MQRPLFQSGRTRARHGSRSTQQKALTAVTAHSTSCGPSTSGRSNAYGMYRPGRPHLRHHASNTVGLDCCFYENTIGRFADAPFVPSMCTPGSNSRHSAHSQLEAAQADMRRPHYSTGTVAGSSRMTCKAAAVESAPAESAPEEYDYLSSK